MEIRKSYRRWCRRRLGVLGPALGAAALLMAHLALAEDVRPSARIALLATVGLVGALFAFTAALTLYAHRLHRSGRRPEGRMLRHLLEPAERLVAPALLLLLPAALAPAVFRRPEDLPRPPVVLRESPRPHFVAPLPPPPPGPLPVTEAVAELPPPVQEAPEPVVDAAPPPPARRDDTSDNDVFRLRAEDVVAESWPSLKTDFSRFGVPEDGRPLEGRPSAVELDVLVLWGDDAPVGSGLALRFDLPTSGGPLLRLSTLYVTQTWSDDLLAETDAFALSHTTFDAVFRVAGGTRRAALDLFVSVGLAVDAADGGEVDGAARLSPHVAVDLALWQTGQMGLVFHAGQTIPTALTGGSAAITELSATFRIDFSERISLRAGWQHMILHLRDYDGPLETGESIASLDRDFSGPLIGLELRF